MREVTAVLTKQLTLGLRPERLGPNTSPAMLELVNLLPSGMGLVNRDEFLEPIDEPPAELYPFPHVATTVVDILVATPNGTFLVNGSWDLVAIAGTAAQWTDIPHVADFGDFFCALGPGGSVFGGLQVEGVGRTAIQHALTSADTCCAFRGQLIVGAPRDFSVLRTQADPMSDFEIPPVGDRIVAWSRIGALDFRALIGNEVGWTTMPWQGKVLRILELGDSAIAYCENGIARMSPRSEPVQTFGIDRLCEFGVLNRNAIAGDDQLHLFIGKDRALYTLSPEKRFTQEGRAPKRLGYAEYMKRLVNPKIFHDPTHQRWWIFDGVRCFVWSPAGLAEVTNVPKSLAMYMGELIGIAAGDLTITELCTDTLTFGTRGLKTMQTIEVDATASAGFSVSVDWRTETAGDWNQTAWIPCSPHGVAFPMVTGSEFRIRVRCAAVDAEVGQINLRYKLSDKRSVRGIVYAGSTDGGAGQ